MMKVLLLCVLSMSISQAFCQQDSLLRNFKFRISKFRALSFGLGGGANYNNTDYPAGVSENSNGGGAIGIGYFTTKSTDRILSTQSSSLNSNYSQGKGTTNVAPNKFKNFSAASGIRTLNKWFSKNKFIELGADGYGSSSRGEYNTKNAPEISRQNYDEYSIALNTGIGIGRLENITDMQNALWLNKALEKSNSLDRPLSAAELHELGRSITKANNTRVLDSRKRIQFALETVDSFFQKNNLLSKADIKYFSNLNDILFFAFNNYRLSGTEKFIRLTPVISDYRNDNSQNNTAQKFEERALIKSLNFSVGINKHVPLNLAHQNNFGAALQLNYIEQDYSNRFFTSGTITNELKNSATRKQAALDLFFEHAIYPNTRTAVNIRMQTLSGIEELEKNTEFFGSARVDGDFNYFISYRTRLNFGLGAFYQHNTREQYRYMGLLPNTLQLFVNAGISVNM